jgi:hypothetical protein
MHGEKIKISELFPVLMWDVRMYLCYVVFVEMCQEKIPTPPPSPVPQILYKLKIHFRNTFE